MFSCKYMHCTLDSSNSPKTMQVISGYIHTGLCRASTLLLHFRNRKALLTLLLETFGNYNTDTSWLVLISHIVSFPHTQIPAGMSVSLLAWKLLRGVLSVCWPSPPKTLSTDGAGSRLEWRPSSLLIHNMFICFSFNFTEQPKTSRWWETWRKSSTLVTLWVFFFFCNIQVYFSWRVYPDSCRVYTFPSVCIKWVLICPGGIFQELMPWDHPFLSGVLRAERWAVGILCNIFFSLLSFDKVILIRVFVVALDVCKITSHQGVSCCWVPALSQVSGVTKGVKRGAWEFFGTPSG